MKSVINGEPAVLERAGINAIRPEMELFQENLEDPCGEYRYLDTQHIYQLYPTNDRRTVIPGIHVPYNGRRALAINFVLPKHVKKEPVQFSIIQQSGTRVIGGSTYILHPKYN
jgi:hypothetical protein